MSMHKTPLSAQEREGLISAGLPVDKPSQLADAFRLGMKHTDCMLGREVQAIKDATPKSNEELCVWLRKNSSGIYRNSALAAAVIEELEKEVDKLVEQRILQMVADLPVESHFGSEVMGTVKVMDILEYVDKMKRVDSENS